MYSPQVGGLLSLRTTSAQSVSRAFSLMGKSLGLISVPAARTAERMLGKWSSSRACLMPVRRVNSEDEGARRSLRTQAPMAERVLSRVNGPRFLRLERLMDVDVPGSSWLNASKGF